jgi:hypothetical protein
MDADGQRSAPHIQASLDILSNLLSHPAMPSHLSALQEAMAAASIQVRETGGG